MSAKPSHFSFIAESDGQLKIDEEDMGSSRMRDVDYHKSLIKGSTLRYRSKDGFNRFETAGSTNPHSTGGGSGVRSIREWPLRLGLEFHIIAILLDPFKSVVAVLKNFVKA